MFQRFSNVKYEFFCGDTKIDYLEPLSSIKMKSIYQRKLFWNFFFSIFIFWNELWKEGKIMKHKRIHYGRWETIHYNSHLCIFMRKLFFFFLCGRICGGRWKNTWKFKRDALNIEEIISLELLLISIYELFLNV